MAYSGWTNDETWAVNQRFGETFAYFEEMGIKSPTSFRDCVEESFLNSKVTPLEREFIMMSLSRVDWNEIADHYQSEKYLIDEG